MTINHVYEIINNAMKKLEGINTLDYHKGKANQKYVNEVYDILDKLKDELIRENIKNKQRRSK